MKKFVFITSVWLGVFASGAFAADVSVWGSAGEIVQGSDNYFLQKNPTATTFHSWTSANLNYLARTPDTNLLLHANTGYSVYFGPNASNTFDTNGIPVDVTFQADHQRALNTYNFEASFHRADLPTTQLTETGIVTNQGFVNAYGVGGGITQQMTRTDSIGWSVHERYITFTNSNQPSYNNISTALNWRHNFSPITNLTNSINFDYSNADDFAGSQRLFWHFRSALVTQFSNRLYFFGSIGAGISNTYQDNPIGAKPTPVAFVGYPSFQFLTTNYQYGIASTFQPGVSSSVIANVGLTYKLFNDTDLAFTAGQNIIPTITGGIQEISTVGITVNHRVNRLSNLAFSTQYAHSNFSGVSSDFFSGQVKYGYRLTKHLATELSYTYRLRDDNVTGTADSSTVLASLRYYFTLLGNPNERDITEAKRARARLMSRTTHALPDF